MPRVIHGADKRGERWPEYRAWDGMIQRCTNASTWYWQYYGGRGITVCNRWRTFANFFADMGPKPSDGHSLDRIDNNGNYEPGNCRWATWKEQGANARKYRKARPRKHIGPLLRNGQFSSSAAIHVRYRMRA